MRNHAAAVIWMLLYSSYALHRFRYTVHRIIFRFSAWLWNWNARRLPHGHPVSTFVAGADQMRAQVIEATIPLVDPPVPPERHAEEWRARPQPTPSTL